MVEALLSRFSAVLQRDRPEHAARDADATARLRTLAEIPYPRLRFRGAVRRVRGALGPSSPNPHSATDLSHDEEHRLSRSFNVPFWVHDYPEGVRDSLHRRSGTGTYDSYELVLRFGYGELSTGGLRPDSAPEIRRQSRSLGRKRHPDYASWKERTGSQSRGLGIGLERLVACCSSRRAILDVRRHHDSGPNATRKGEGRHG